MGPQEFFERTAPPIHDVDSEFIIGPVGSDPSNVTHQLAITFHSTPGGETVKVMSADTDPNNHSITEATISTVAGGEFQASDFQIGERMEENEIDLRFVPTALGEADINVAEPDPANNAGIYIGTVATHASADPHIAQLYTGKFEGDTDYYISPDAYARAMQQYEN